MKRKPITIALALLLVASFAFAGMNEKGRGMNAENKIKGENYQLLTEDQRDKIADAKRDFEKKAILLRAEAKVLAIEVNEMITNGKIVKDIAATQNKLNNVKAQLAQEQLEHKVDVRKIVGEDKYKLMHNRYMHVGSEGRGDRKMGKNNPRYGNEKPNAYGEGGRQYYKRPIVK